jgi:hypothetical protein
MIIEELYIVLWAILAGGIYYSFKEYGKRQYGEGMTDAICMHNEGTLKYKVIIDANGHEDIEIQVKGG